VKSIADTSFVVAVANRHIPQLQELARRYSDRNPDLADLCLIRMSELHPRHSILTVDEADFAFTAETNERPSRSFVLLTFERPRSPDRIKFPPLMLGFRFAEALQFCALVAILAASA
jgi:hypothetical protein